MKKLLIILMVVAMASFLFVGCLPSVTPEVEEEEEEEEVVVTATVAPIITAVAGISITSSSTQYINATEAAVVTVTGTAPTYSEVRVYIDGVTAGTANVGDTGTFTVVIAEADLGADGDKVLYATAKEAALDESAHSVEYAFILDQVKPTATTLTATANTAAVATADSAIVSGVSIVVDSFGVNGLGTLTSGTWTISVVADSGVTGNVVISDGTTSTTYTVASPLPLFNGVIPGVQFTFVAAGVVVGNVNTVTIVATPQIVDRATILYSEAVTTASATAAANFAWWNTSTAVATAATVVTYKNLTTYFTPFVAVLAQYDLIGCAVNGAVDLAGNIQTTASAVTTTVVAASATALAP